MILLGFASVLANVAIANTGCGPPSIGVELEGILRALASPQADHCQLPGVGSTEDLDYPATLSPTTVEQKYRIFRRAPDQVSIVFSFQFPSPTLDREWKERVRNCFSNLKSRIRAPTGEYISFEVYDGTQGSSPPPSVPISISATGRGNAREWITSFGCPEIWHEALHSAGIVDEYPETQIGMRRDPATGQWTQVAENAEVPVWTCRRLYPKNTVMADPERAWRATFAGNDLRVDFCSCARPGGCAEYFAERQAALAAQIAQGISLSEMRLEYPSACPAGFTKSGIFQEFPIPDDMKSEVFDQGRPVGLLPPAGLTAEQLAELVPIYQFTRLSREGNALLETRHLNALLYPGCVAKNWQYYQDARNAYRTRPNCVDHSWAGAIH